MRLPFFASLGTRMYWLPTWQCQENYVRVNDLQLGVQCLNVAEFTHYCPLGFRLTASKGECITRRRRCDDGYTLTGQDKCRHTKELQIQVDCQEGYRPHYVDNTSAFVCNGEAESCATGFSMNSSGECRPDVGDGPTTPTCSKGRPKPDWHGHCVEDDSVAVIATGCAGTLALDKCLFEHTTESQPGCRIGRQLASGCTNVEWITFKKCPTGFEDAGSRCEKTPAVAATISCSPGYKLNNGICIRDTTKRYVSVWGEPVGMGTYV